MNAESLNRFCVVPCELTPPLYETWFIQYRGMFADIPIVQGGLVFARNDDDTLAAYDEVEHRVVWEYKRKGTLKFITEGTLFFVAHDKSAHIIDSRSGQVLGVHPFNRNGDIVPAGSIFVCTSYEGSTLMTAFEMGSVKKRWNYRSHRGQPFFMLCATEERIIVGETSQSGEGGRVLAINAENGSVAWEHSVSDLPLHMPGEKTRGGVPGTAAVYKGILVVVVPKDFVVGLSVETGERLWTWTSDLSSAVSDAGSCFYSGRFYQLGSNGSYHIIDPHHGDTVFEIMLKARLPEKLRTVWGWKPSLVSETHLFVGSNDGHVLGFDRETGDYVWSILPKGGSAVARFSCASRRLYYADLGGRLHCLAPRPS